MVESDREFALVKDLKELKYPIALRDAIEPLTRNNASSSESFPQLMLISLATAKKIIIENSDITDIVLDELAAIVMFLMPNESHQFSLFRVLNFNLASDDLQIKFSVLKVNLINIDF